MVIFWSVHGALLGLGWFDPASMLPPSLVLRAGAGVRLGPTVQDIGTVWKVPNEAIEASVFPLIMGDIVIFNHCYDSNGLPFAVG